MRAVAPDTETSPPNASLVPGSLAVSFCCSTQTSGAVVIATCSGSESRGLQPAVTAVASTTDTREKATPALAPDRLKAMNPHPPEHGATPAPRAIRAPRACTAADLPLFATL